MTRSIRLTRSTLILTAFFTGVFAFDLSGQAVAAGTSGDAAPSDKPTKPLLKVVLTKIKKKGGVLLCGLYEKKEGFPRDNSTQQIPAVDRKGKPQHVRSPCQSRATTRSWCCMT